jgi:uncharacterized alkaline shock family protein YloU
MSKLDKESLGKIEVSPIAVASIVNHAVRQCYGVVGMANKNLADGIAHLLSRDSRQGIEVNIDGNEIIVDVYVIIEYGMRISAVANSIKHTVSFHIVQTLGIPPKAVNVFVHGLRFSQDD